MKRLAKILSFALAAAMVCNMIPAIVFAAETGAITAECHPTHDENCGYIEAIEGVACSHLNEDGTYTCALDEDTDYVCAHDDECGYAEAVEGALCTHACDICRPQESGEPEQKCTCNPIVEDESAHTSTDCLFYEEQSPECSCTVKCAAANEENEIETSINPDCPVCGAESADLSVCKGEVPVPFAAKRAVTKRSTILNLEEKNIKDNNGNVLAPADGVYDMLSVEGWKWDSKTNILTLDGADINVPSDNAILLPANATIELLGENSAVNSNPKFSNAGAIYGRGTLTLSGSGSLNINSRASAIFSKQMIINGGTINATSTKGVAIVTTNTLTISGSANVTASAYSCGLQSNTRDIIISGGKVNAISSTDSAIFTPGNLHISGSADVTANGYLSSIQADGNQAGDGITISDSTVEAISSNDNAIYTRGTLDIGQNAKITATGGDYCGLHAKGAITIADADVKATASNNTAIYSLASITVSGNADIAADGKLSGLSSLNVSISDDAVVKATSTTRSAITGKTSLSITGNADVTAKGYWCGIEVNGDIAFTGSTVDAVGNGGYGISTTGKIAIDSGAVYAKGASTYAAIRAKNVQTGSEGAESKISLTNLIEKNGGKVAFSDWVSGSETISWTTIIDKDDDGLATTPDGGFANGLLEVWLAAPHTVTFNVNGGSGTDSTVKVYPGNTVSAPATDPSKDGSHLSGWYLDSTKFDFANTAITENVTLKAKFDTHTPNEDDGDCTTAIHCSACDYITTAAKTHHTLSGWKSDGTNHWKECENADCTHKEQEAAHTWNTGEITTPATITQEGVKTYTCTVCLQTKTEVIPKLPSKNTIVDDATGSEVEYEDGSKFDDVIELVVTPQDEKKTNSYKENVDKVVQGSLIAELYDVKLLKNGVAIQPDGKIKVSLKLTDEMKAMTNLQVVYIDDNGNVTLMPSEVQNGKIIFTTDHLSYYGVIGKVKTTLPEKPNDSDTPKTGDSTPILPFVFIALLSGGSLFGTVMYKKRKKYRVK